MEKKLMHNQAYLINLLDYNSWANDEFFKVIIKLPIVRTPFHLISY